MSGMRDGGIAGGEPGNRGMIRMFRRIWKIIVTLAIAVVGIVWLAMGVLCVRSYWRGDVISLSKTTHEEPPVNPNERVASIRRTRTYLLLSGRGGLGFAMSEYTKDRGPQMLDETSWTSHESPGYPVPPDPKSLAGFMVTDQGPVS